MSNDTCQRSNGINVTTVVKIYVAGDPGTPFQIDFDWTEDMNVTLLAHATVIGSMSAGTPYSSLATISATSAPGQADAKSASGQSMDTGFTSGDIIVSGGSTYSLARTHTLTGNVSTNGQCFSCDIVPNCCACGAGTAVTTIHATLL